MDLSQQTERCYQKQPTIFENKKQVLGARRLNRSELRFTRNVGLGFKTPAFAKEGTFVDKKCNRYEKRHKKISAHMSPAFLDVKLGDVATVGQCRPLSKTVRFNVIKVGKLGGGKKFSKF